MASAAEIAIVISGKNQASGAIKEVSGDLGGLNKAADAVSFAVLTNGVGQAGDAASSAIGKVTELTGATSDLAENMSKSNTIFKGNAKEIENWAAGGAKDFGLSKNAALDAASGFGNMFTQLGIGQDEAANMSMGITELAADFASFHNADISSVLDAQSAAFRGEYDSLQQFLPLINAATVEQKAMAMTGKENAKELTAQEKALAVNTLMFEGADEAMGDFDRTATGLANTERTLAAEQENMAATMGSKVIPIQQKLLETYAAMPATVQTAGAVVSMFGGEAVTMAGGLGQAVLGMKAFGPALSGVGGAVKGAASAMKLLSLTMLAPPMGIVVALAAIGVAAYIFRDDIMGALRAAADAVMPIIRSIGSTIGGLVGVFKGVGRAVGSFGTKVAGSLSSAVGTISGVVKSIADAITGAFSSVLDFLKGSWPEIATIISGPFFPIVALATDAFGIRTAITNAFNAILDFTGQVWGAIKGAITAAWEEITASVQHGIDSATQRVTDGWNWINEQTNALWGTIKGAITAAWEEITASVQHGIDSATQRVTDGWNWINEQTNALWGTIKGTIMGAWDEITGAVAAALGTIEGVISGGFQSVVGVVQGAMGEIAGAAQQGMSSMLGAIQNGVSQAVSAVTDGFNGMVNAVSGVMNGLAGIISNAASSAANAAYNAGRNILQRFADGLTAFVPSLPSPNIPDVTPWNGLTPFASGTPFVPRDMPAFIHRGEAIIPAAQNPFNPANGAGGGGGGITVNMYNPTVYARDKEDARRGAGDAAYGLVKAAQMRGLAV